MTAPAKKFEEYAQELGTKWRLVPELRLRQIVAELKRLLSKATPEDAGWIHSVIGGAYMRLRKIDDAVHHIKLAARLRTHDHEVFTNLGWAYFEIGKPLDALDAWVTASELHGGYNPIVLGNLAEVFAVLGHENDAWHALREAIRVAKPNHLESLFVLAQQSAELGADQLAAEFFARFLSVLVGKAIGRRPAEDIIRSERPDSVDLSSSPALDASIRRVLEFGDVLAPLRRAAPERSDAVSDDAIASALAMFEATRESRARATESAIASHITD